MGALGSHERKKCKHGGKKGHKKWYYSPNTVVYLTNTSCGNELHAALMWGACGVSRWDRESNENMYRRFGMSETAVGMDCVLVERVQRSTPRWYGHVTRMNECDFTKRVYESTTEGRGVRGRPPVKWINRVEEYWRERVGGRGLEWAGRVPEQGDLETTLLWPPPWGRFPGGDEASEV